MTDYNEMQRTVKRRGQIQSDKGGGDLGTHLPNDARTGSWKIVIRKCDFMDFPSLVGMMRRYLSFGIVGASGMGLDMAALFVLADPGMLHLNLSLSKALAAQIAILSNFIWNEFWTFHDIAIIDPSWRGRTTRLAKFNLICLAGIGLSVLLLNVEMRYMHMNMYVGNLVAILVVSVWNFCMNLKFGWTRTGIS